MVAQSSHDDHVILEGHYVTEVMGGHADWSSDGGLGCDGMRSNGPGRIWSEPIHETEQVGELLRGVGEVRLTGPKYERLNGT